MSFLFVFPSFLSVLVARKYICYSFLCFCFSFFLIPQFHLTLQGVWEVAVCQLRRSFQLAMFVPVVVVHKDESVLLYLWLDAHCSLGAPGVVSIVVSYSYTGFIL